MLTALDFSCWKTAIVPCCAVTENQYLCFFWGLLALKAICLRFNYSTVFMSLHYQKTPTFQLPLPKLFLKKFCLAGLAVASLTDKKAEVLGSNWSVFLLVMLLWFTLGKDLTQWIFAFYLLCMGDLLDFFSFFPSRSYWTITVLWFIIKVQRWMSWRQNSLT